MKNIFMHAMQSKFDLGKMLDKIKQFYIADMLTPEEAEELENLAREKAGQHMSSELEKKIVELEARIRKLEAEKPAETVPEEFVKGKWYYTGDKMIFNLRYFECTAPKDVVCVWSPEEYPAYWKEYFI